MTSRYEDAVQTHRRLAVEEMARRDADSADLRYPEEGMKFPLSEAVSYWSQIVYSGELSLYSTAYRQRIDRRMRRAA